MPNWSFMGYMLVKRSEQEEKTKRNVELLESLARQINKLKADEAILQSNLSASESRTAGEALKVKRLTEELQQARKMIFGIPNSLPSEIADAVDWEAMGIADPPKR